MNGELNGGYSVPHGDPGNQEPLDVSFGDPQVDARLSSILSEETKRTLLRNPKFQRSPSLNESLPSYHGHSSSHSGFGASHQGDPYSNLSDSTRAYLQQQNKYNSISPSTRALLIQNETPPSRRPDWKYESILSPETRSLVRKSSVHNENIPYFNGGARMMVHGGSTLMDRMKTIKQGLDVKAKVNAASEISSANASHNARINALLSRKKNQPVNVEEDYNSRRNNLLFDDNESTGRDNLFLDDNESARRSSQWSVASDVSDTDYLIEKHRELSAMKSGLRPNNLSLRAPSPNFHGFRTSSPLSPCNHDIRTSSPLGFQHGFKSFTAPSTPLNRSFDFGEEITDHTMARIYGKENWTPSEILSPPGSRTESPFMFKENASNEPDDQNDMDLAEIPFFNRENAHLFALDNPDNVSRPCAPTPEKQASFRKQNSWNSDQDTKVELEDGERTPTLENQSFMYKGTDPSRLSSQVLRDKVTEFAGQISESQGHNSKGQGNVINKVQDQSDHNERNVILNDSALATAQSSNGAESTFQTIESEESFANNTCESETQKTAVLSNKEQADKQSKPAYSDDSKPTVSHETKPTASHEPKPTTSHEPKPTTSRDSKPTTSRESSKPTASRELVKAQELLQKIQEVKELRVEALSYLSTLTDRNKQYRLRMEKEENNKKQQIKIMKKSHEAHLQEKEQTINDLQDLVEELQSKVNNEEEGEESENSSSKSVNKILNQLKNLQQEKADLTQRILTLENDLDQNQGHAKQEAGLFKEMMEKLEKENNTLQEEIIRLRSKKGVEGTDTEKHVYKLESDVERLQRELQNAQSELKQAQFDSHTHSTEDDKQLKKLKEDNSELKDKVRNLERDLELKDKLGSQSEGQLKEKIKTLTSENQVLSTENRQSVAKLLAMQADAPKVVTKLETIEVENEACQRELTHTKTSLLTTQSQNAELEERVTSLASNNAKLEQEVAALRVQVKETAAKYQEAHKQASQLDEVVTEKSRLTGEVSRLQQEYTTTSQQLKESQNVCHTLQSKIKEAEKATDLLRGQMLDDLNDLRKAQEEEVDNLRKQYEETLCDLQEVIKTLKAQLSVMAPELTELRRSYKQLRKDAHNMPNVIKTTVDFTTKQILNALKGVSEYNQQLVSKYRREMLLRKKYHNELVELKGNIRVLCRVRPKITEDGQGPQSKSVVSYDLDDDALINVLFKERQQVFELDKVFDAKSTQQQVFDEVQNVVTSCVDGYNVCIFAYGQTGSGKTYTMEGPPADRGINQRALKQLFKETEERSGEWTYKITVAVIEIYNEMIRDLLSSDPTYKLEVKMLPEGGLHVPGLTSREVCSVDDVNQVFTTGTKNRQTAATNMNEHSSRSHALLCVKVVGVNTTTHAKSIGKLNLVDLAGSERVSKSGADGTRLKEAQNINKSLSSLGDVIHALRSGRSHVPYRNSKLTYLLQDSLGGDSKTLMIVQVSPVDKNVGETLASLNFAQRVRSVELGQATKKVENTEIQELREKLAQYEDGSLNGSSNGYRPSSKSNTPNKPNKKK